MTEIISSSGEELPTPSSYVPRVNVIYSEETKRDTTAYLHIHRIASKYQIDMTWNLLSPAEFARLWRITDSDDLSISFWNPTINGFSNIICYRGNVDYKPIGPFEEVNGEPSNFRYIGDVSMSLIER